MMQARGVESNLKGSQPMYLGGESWENSVSAADAERGILKLKRCPGDGVLPYCSCLLGDCQWLMHDRWLDAKATVEADGRNGFAAQCAAWN